MTNKEAIEQLEWVKKRISNITYSPESFEAINMAIEALKTLDNNTAILDEKSTNKLLDIIEKEADNDSKRTY